jgi:hypothetical protein
MYIFKQIAISICAILLGLFGLFATGIAGIGSTSFNSYQLVGIAIVIAAVAILWLAVAPIVFAVIAGLSGVAMIVGDVLLGGASFENCFIWIGIALTALAVMRALGVLFSDQ